MKAVVSALVVAAVAAVPLGGATADARPFWDRGGASLHYDVTYLRGTGDGAPADDLEGGFRLHSFIGPHRVGYAVGLDLHGGATLDGDHRYESNFYLVGLGTSPTRGSQVRLNTGIGVFGGHGIDDGARWPLELGVELPLGRRLRLLGRARAVWRVVAPSKPVGPIDLPAPDQVEAMLAVRLGKRYRAWGLVSGNGYFVGATLREEGGAHFVGLTFGYGVDLQKPPSKRDSDCGCDSGGFDDDGNDLEQNDR